MHQYRNSISKSNRIFCPSKIFLWQRQEKKLPLWSWQITNRDALSLQIPEWHECVVSLVPQKKCFCFHHLLDEENKQIHTLNGTLESPVMNYWLPAIFLQPNVTYLTYGKLHPLFIYLTIIYIPMLIKIHGIFFSMRPDNSDDESGLTAFN